MVIKSFYYFSLKGQLCLAGYAQSSVPGELKLYLVIINLNKSFETVEIFVDHISIIGEYLPENSF